MTDEQKALADRIAAIETRVTELSSFLRSAIGYVSSDPASSLTKSRVTLEKVLLNPIPQNDEQGAIAADDRRHVGG